MPWGPNSVQSEPSAVEIIRPDGQGPVVLVCEHASRLIPSDFDGLGLNEAAQISHAAWDIGARDVAVVLSELFDAPLVAGGVSRLIYDLNRPLSASSAIPEKSEVFDVPGNRGLSASERQARFDAYHEPFHTAVDAILAARGPVAFVTIHSFTPVYHGQFREVEIGILHDSDSRLADAMLAGAEGCSLTVNRNDPYGPEDGVTHTLRLHALPDGLLNVMIEIRNDLISSEGEQAEIAGFLHELMGKALSSIDE